MKNKFTPGPWHIVSGTVLDQHNNIIATCPSMENLDPESGRISRTSHSKPHINPVEAGNNRSLIAAAPELLGQLDAAYDELAYLIRHDLIPMSEMSRLGALQANMTEVMLRARGGTP